MATGKARTATQPDQAATTLAIALGAFAVTVWAGGPIATSYLVDRIDPIAVAVLRTILAAAIMLPAALIGRLPRPADRDGWLLLAVAGLGGFVGFTLLNSFGQRHTTTGHAALILGASPIVTGLIGFALVRAWPRPLWWAGAGIAMAGVALLVLSRSGTSARADASLHGDLLVVGSILCSGAGYACGGRLAARIGTWSVTAWGISLAGFVSLPVLLWRWGTHGVAWGDLSAGGWLALAYLAVVVSVIGYLAFYRAIGMAGVARVAPLQFGQPMISLVFAVILFDERITLPIAVAALVILGGMALARRATSG